MSIGTDRVEDNPTARRNSDCRKFRLRRPWDRNAADTSHRVRSYNYDSHQPFPPGKDGAPRNARTREDNTTHIKPNTSAE
jgi:hypothetical protein